MSDKIRIKVKDGTCNHAPSFIEDSEFIQYIKNMLPNNNGDISVNEGDIVMYTNLFQKI